MSNCNGWCVRAPLSTLIFSTYDSSNQHSQSYLGVGHYLKLGQNIWWVLWMLTFSAQFQHTRCITTYSTLFSSDVMSFGRWKWMLKVRIYNITRNVICPQNTFKWGHCYGTNVLQLLHYKLVYSAQKKIVQNSNCQITQAIKWETVFLIFLRRTFR